MNPPYDTWAVSSVAQTKRQAASGTVRVANSTPILTNTAHLGGNGKLSTVELVAVLASCVAVGFFGRDPLIYRDLAGD